MSTPTETRSPSRRLVVALAVAGIAVLAVVAALLTSRGQDGDTTPSASATTTAATSTSPAPATVVPPPTPSASGPTEDVDALPSAQAAVGLDAGAAVAGAVTARLSDVSVVQVTGQGPGSVSGRTLQVTVELTNSGGTEIPLSGVDVTADTGDDHVPAAPVNDGRSTGLGGAVAPGATATGTYLFSLPDDESTVTVLVGYQAGAPLMVFTGGV